MLGGAPKDRDELIVAKRLLDVVRRRPRFTACIADCSVACAVIRITGISGSLLPRRGEHLETADGRHADVAEDDVRLQRGDLLQTLPAAKCNVCREPLVLEENAQRIDYSRLVIDDEDGRPRLRAFAHLRPGSPVFW